MTREEAINHIKDILAEATETEDAVCYVTNGDAEALEMAIEELQAQQEPLLVARAIDEDTLARFKEVMANQPLMFIKNEPRIEALQAQQWIPVSERLPEVGEVVLLTIHEIGWNGCEYDSVVSGVYNSNKKHILAWMPLPKPYQEDKQ